jgi:hypothetical protein
VIGRASTFSRRQIFFNFGGKKCVARSFSWLVRPVVAWFPSARLGLWFLDPRGILPLERTRPSHVGSKIPRTRPSTEIIPGADIKARYEAVKRFIGVFRGSITVRYDKN